MTHSSSRALVAITVAVLAVAPLSLEAQGKKVRLGIVSAMDPELQDAFYDEVAKYNGWVDSEARPASDKEADAMVYFLNTWADAPGAAGVAENEALLSELTALPADKARHEITITFEDGRKLPLIFYALEASGFQALTCYAQDVARVLDDGSTALTEGNCVQ